MCEGWRFGSGPCSFLGSIMQMLARSVVPVTGDRIVVGQRLAHVIYFDPLEKLIAYALRYEHRDSPLFAPAKDYKLMDQELPHIWRRPNDKIQFQLSYRWHGRTVTTTVVDKTRASARSHLLRRLGTQNLSQNLLPQAYVAWAQRRLAEENGKSAYEPQMIVVSLP